MTNAQRLMFVMLADLFRGLDIESEIDPDFLDDAIANHCEWAIDLQYPGISGDNPDPMPAAPKETQEILNMWTVIEETVQDLDTGPREKVAEQCGPWGERPTFRGFDGNNESKHLNAARFLIKKMGRFPNFEGRDLNSHMPILWKYRAMLRVYDDLLLSSGGFGLHHEDLIKILSAE